MTRAEKAISVRVRSQGYVNYKENGYSRSENMTMKKVMKETDGYGGPWFGQFSIRKGLL